MILLFSRSRVASVILLPENTSLNPKHSVFGDHWVPVSWAWYWHAKEFILGKPRTVVIHATFVHVVRPKAAAQSSFPHAVKATTNLHIYFVSSNQCARMRKDLTAGESHSREWAAQITTSQGTRTRMSMGGPSAQSPSFSLEVVPRRRAGYTDLLTSIQEIRLGDSVSNPITNLTLTARFQIPKDHAVFLLKSGEPPDDPISLGVILTPKWK